MRVGVFRPHWWPACWGALPPLPLPQTAKRAGELAATRPSCWNLSLCVYYNILHFFLPLSKQQASRHLGYFKFVPPRSTLYPYPLVPHAHTHARRDDSKRKWIHVLFFFSFSASFTKVNTWICCEGFFLLWKWYPVPRPGCGFREQTKAVSRLSAMILRLF